MIEISLLSPTIKSLITSNHYIKVHSIQKEPRASKLRTPNNCLGKKFFMLHRFLMKNLNTQAKKCSYSIDLCAY
jgi:hypothetical protein